MTGRFRKISLRTVLLALLAKHRNTGYGIGRLFQHELSHLWGARLQQIYAELARLLDDGLVEMQKIELPNRPAKKIYSLTPAGEEALDQWLSQRPAVHGCKDDFMVFVYCLERIPLETAARRIEERLDACGREVYELKSRLATNPSKLGHLLTVEAALLRAETQAVWCERALSTVRGGAGGSAVGRRKDDAATG